MHADCTTGVEAYFMRKPCVSYVPENVSQKTLNWLPIKLSLSAKTITELENIIIYNYCPQSIYTNENDGNLQKYINNFLHNSNIELINALCEISELNRKVSIKYPIIKYSFRKLLSRFIDRYSILKNTIYYKKKESYNKLRSLKKGEVKNEISSFILLNEFSYKVEVVQRGPQCFHLKKS